jgi:hypothetical protein
MQDEWHRARLLSPGRGSDHPRSVVRGPRQALVPEARLQEHHPRTAFQAPRQKERRGLTWTADHERAYRAEIERRFRARTPPTSALDGHPEDRVLRGELRGWAIEHCEGLPPGSGVVALHVSSDRPELGWPA